MRALPHLVLLATSVCLLAVPLDARAGGDQRPIEILLDNGETLTGVVESIGPTGLVLRIGDETRRPIPLDRLAPLGLFRARSAHTPVADGASRLALAEFAVDLGLFAEARVEFEKALALGALDDAAFAKALAAAEGAAVEVGLAEARTRAAAGDHEGALEVARRLRVDFAEAPGADAIGRLIQSLIDDLAAIEAADAAARDELEKFELGVARAKEIFRRKTLALDLLREGRRIAAETREKRDQGSVTRSRKLAEQADERFMAARRHLGRLRRILPNDAPERPEILAALNHLDREQFDLLFGMARFLFREARVFTDAERFAARASAIDPVHPDLIELRDQIVASRIRFRASDVTNIHGTVSGGGIR